MDFNSVNATAPGGTVPPAGGTPAPPRTPPENCEAVLYQNQIVKLNIPHNTPRSKGIRDFIKTYMLNEKNERMFIFRTETGWTTIAFNSRPDVPVVTIHPIRCAEACTTVLVQCPDVATVTLKNANNDVMTLDQVRAMPFLPLPSQTPNVTLPPQPHVTNPAAGLAPVMQPGQPANPPPFVPPPYVAAGPFGAPTPYAPPPVLPVPAAYSAPACAGYPLSTTSSGELAPPNEIGTSMVAASAGPTASSGLSDPAMAASGVSTSAPLLPTPFEQTVAVLEDKMTDTTDKLDAKIADVASNVQTLATSLQAAISSMLASNRELMTMMKDPQVADGVPAVDLTADHVAGGSTGGPSGVLRSPVRAPTAAGGTDAASAGAGSSGVVGVSAALTAAGQAAEARMSATAVSSSADQPEPATEVRSKRVRKATK